MRTAREKKADHLENIRDSVNECIIVREIPEKLASGLISQMTKSENFDYKNHNIA